MNTSNYRTIVYEGFVDGHRKEYIEHLLRYLKTKPSIKERYVFILNAQLVEELRSVLVEVEDINIVSVTPIRGNKLLKESFYEWRLIEEVLKCYTGVKEIIFMNLDLFQYVILSPRFHKHNLTIKGILFQPYHQLPRAKISSISSLKSRLRYYRKLLVLKLVAKLKANVKIYLLNDKNGVQRLNEALSPSQPKFHFLPDPIDSGCRCAFESKEAVCERYSIEKDRDILLIFGVIDFRKNVHRVIEALTLLPKTEQLRYALLVVGKFQDELVTGLNDLRTKVMELWPLLSIVFDNKYCSNDEREEVLNASYIVMMPYIDFYSSSGVVGHAIKYSKRIVVSSKGLVPVMTSGYPLSISVDSYSASEIASGIQAIDCKSVDEEALQLFVEKSLKAHSPKMFAHTLLSV